MLVCRWFATNGTCAQVSSPANPLPILLLLFLMLGSVGCHAKPPQRTPLAWTTSKTKGCDIERIWSHTLDGLADLTDTELTTCESACKRGDREACVGAGLMLYTGATARKNTFEGRRLFHQQCKAHVGPGCISLWMTDLAEAKGIAARPGGGRDLFWQCIKGEKHACEAMGRYLPRPLSGTSRVSRHDEALYYLTKACNAGSLFGCTGLGELYLSGLGFPRDSKKAAEIFHEQCQKGHVPACANLGVLYNKGTGVQKDSAKALELWRNACDGGSPKACYEFGQMHWFTDESEYDYDAEPVNSEIALAHFHKACVGGIGDACHKLASAYLYRGILVDQDVARSLRYEEAACKLRVGEACHALGENYSEGDDVEADEARAAEYYELACSLGHAEGCARMGEIFLKYDMIIGYAGLARARFVQACSGLVTGSCYKVSRMLALGIGGPKDEKSALVYLQKACESADSDACSDLKFYSHYRTFPPTTQGEMESIYLPACHAGKMRACIDLGYLYRDIEDGAWLPEAAVLFQKACAAGAQEGCLELGEAYFEGRGVTQDEAKGLQIDTDACRARYAWACYLLGVRFRDGLGVAPDPFKAVMLLDDACPKVDTACTQAQALRARIREEHEKANSKLEGALKKP